MKIWRNQPTDNNWRKPFNNREKAGVYFGLSGMTFALGLSEWFTPSVPPFTGRYSWFFSSLHQLNTELGIVGFYVLITLLLLALGILKWFER